MGKKKAKIRRPAGQLLDARVHDRQPAPVESPEASGERADNKNRVPFGQLVTVQYHNVAQVRISPDTAHRWRPAGRAARGVRGVRGGDLTVAGFPPDGT